MKLFPTLIFLFCLFIIPQIAGAQWVRQYPLDKLEDVLDLDVSSDGYGFAAGTNDLLMRLDPTTQTWELLPGFGANWKFESVDYLDGSEGSVVAAGGNGLIISTDKGETWTQITGPPDGIHTLKLFSADHLIAVTDADAYIWKNNMWRDLDVPVATSVKGAFVLDSMHIWMYTFATDPGIYYSTDGGQTWDVNLDINDIDVVRFFDPLYGIATDARDVYESKDGGVNWELIGDNALTNTVNDLAFGATANVLIGASINAEPPLSIDSGRTWTELDPGLLNQRSFSVVALSNDEFWMGHDLSSVWHTENGGTTWVETSGPDRNIVQDVFFLNRSIGFAVGQKGMLLSTRDGGNHWEDISFGNRSHLTIHGLSETDLWIGANQRILHSSDTGNTWTEVFSPIANNINDIFAISSQRILAATGAGVIYRSNDGGAKWDTVYSLPGIQIKSIAHIDGQRYMATGFNGTILRSEDQGETWAPVSVPEAGLQYEQAYFHGDKGWLVTSSFKNLMWSTTNAGDSWTPITLPVDRFWDGVYFISQDTGIVVGRSTNEGRAYITFNGGVSWSSGYVTNFPLFGVAGVPNPNGTAWIFGYGSDIEVLPYCDVLPVLSNFVGDLDPCEGDTALYYVSSENIDIYSWFFPPGWTIVGNANNDTVDVVIGQASGTITISGSNPCGETGQLSFSAGPNLLPSIFEVQVPETPCPGDDITFSVITLEGDDYLWTLPSGWIPLSSLTESTIVVLAGENSGNVTVEVSNQCGTVERTIIMAVHPAPPEVAVLVAGAQLSLSETGSSYQWVLNGNPIPGATNATYTALQNGLYQAIVTFPTGCTSVTAEVLVTTVATDDPLFSSLVVAPNPVKEIIHVTGLPQSFEYSIIDLTGRVLANNTTQSTIDVADLQDGYYFLKIKLNDRSFISRFVKE